MTPKPEIRHRHGSGPWMTIAAAAITGVLVAGCAIRDGVRDAQPCPGKPPASLGEPETLDNSYATFEVVAGPVWLTVTAWEPGPATGTPFTAPFFLGSMSEPPDDPDSAVVRLADHVVDVVEEQYTQVELEPGAYWVLTTSIVGEAAAIACDGGVIGEVVPAR